MQKKTIAINLLVIFISFILFILIFYIDFVLFDNTLDFGLLRTVPIILFVNSITSLNNKKNNRNKINRNKINRKIYIMILLVFFIITSYYLIYLPKITYIQAKKIIENKIENKEFKFIDGPELKEAKSLYRNKINPLCDRYYIFIIEEYNTKEKYIYFINQFSKEILNIKKV